jgi:iron complex outermembrane receptor protein
VMVKSGSTESMPLRRCLWCCVCACLSVNGAALAQAESDAAAEDLVLEEVTVTATLREVALQDLPMSVGVLTQNQLEDIDAVSLDDFWRLVPNLNVRDAPFGGNSVIIRGLADTDSFQSPESINAFYVDDTALTYVTGLFATPADVALLDVARVEVLRGPQGTLIGANAMGGAIRVITNEPDPSAPARQVDLNLSNTDEGGWNYGGRFMLNQPTGADSAIRLAVMYQDDDGFIDDIGLGRTDVNDQQRAAGRLSWLWNVSDDFDVLVRGYAENIDSGGYNYADPIGQPWKGIFTTDDYQFINYSPEPRGEELRLMSLRLRWRPDWGEFYSATSWFEKDLFLNLDWSPEASFFLGVDSVAPFRTDIQQRDISQEFRLTSNGEARFNWLAGFFYLDQESERLDVGDVEVLGARVLDVNETLDRQDIAVFGEVSWRFTEALEGVLGGRWYQIDRELDQQGSFGGVPIVQEIDGDTSDFVPKASLSWAVNEDVMIYGLISQGFRPGQFNNGLAIAVCGAEPLTDSDDLTNYEAGFKSRLADGDLTLNATAFHIDWDDMQIEAFDLDCQTVFLQNAGKASSRGLEVDFSWLLGERFVLQGGFGYNKAELEEPLPDPEVDAPAGTRIPNVPEWTANIAGTWNFDWSDRLGGYLRADAQYVDSRTTLFDQSPDFPILQELPSYTLVNARLGAERGDWRTEIFVTNLTNELAELFCCRNVWDPAVNRPRTIGVRGTWAFD